MVLVILALAGCGAPAGVTDGGGGSPFVTVDGRRFAVGGRPLAVVGVNLYDAAATDRYSCRPASRMDPGQLAAAFDVLKAHGVTTVRFWAMAPFTDAGRDWSGVDRVVALAKERGMYLVPTLEDGPGNCSTGPRTVPLWATDDDTWYGSGYREPLGSARTSFRDYAPLVAAHYRDEPTILAWMLVNEAETSQRDAQGRSVLVGFAADMAARVRAADPNHLITLGTQSNGALGTSGPDFRDVYSLPGLDFAEAHDWPREGRDPDLAMPGAAADGSLPASDSPECLRVQASLACSFSIASEIGKPLVVGEVGITATEPGQVAPRARVFAEKMSTAFADGAAGYLVWHYSSAPTDGYDVVAGTDDPLLDVIARQSRAQQAALDAGALSSTVPGTL